MDEIAVLHIRPRLAAMAPATPRNVLYVALHWTSLSFAPYLLGIAAVWAPALAHGVSAKGAPQAMITSMRGNAKAFKWYMLNCGGCHRADGKGVPRNGVPSFVDSAGMFTWLRSGREYLIRVPGSASSHLSDEALAQVLNWIVATYSPKKLPPDFVPFTKSEVATVRDHHYQDVAAARRRIAGKLERLGLKPSLYLFGVNKSKDGPASTNKDSGASTGRDTDAF